MDAPLVHLIDSHVYIFRAYHALPAMSAPDGTPTHAAYGFANTLLRYLSERKPTHLACCFDHSLMSFRNRLEPGYKEGRTEPPADLAPQFELCTEVCAALGVPSFQRIDFEADDVVATLVDRLLADGSKVFIVSSDKDLAQLVTEDGSVLFHDFARGRTLDADGVRARFGVDPQQLPDFLGLVGDAVDNLPGVRGVGPRSAAAALQAFGSIEAIPSDPEGWAGVEVRGVARIARSIAAERDRALRTRELARLRRDVPGLALEGRDLRYRGPDPDRAAALFQRLGWGEIATRLPPRS